MSGETNAAEVATMSEQSKNVVRLEDAEQFKELLVERSNECSQPESDSEYRRLRKLLIGEPAIARFVPEYVRSCRTLSEFGDFIGRGFANFSDRRVHVRHSFDGLLSYLENPGQEARRPPPGPGFAAKADEYFSKVVQLLKYDGLAREVAVLTAGDLGFELMESDGDYCQWLIRIRLPLKYYKQMDQEMSDSCCANILKVTRELGQDGFNDWIRDVSINVAVSGLDDWRTDAKRWLRGEGINNQGRVRSDNLPSRQEDGLLFRSGVEIHVYRALKAAGVAFAPLPVFLRGGAGAYQRIEPDFIVLKDGAMMVVEVDGDTVHVESPAEADRRTRIFKMEGALIERVLASECDTKEKASACVRNLIAGFDKWRGQR
ncbi:MULTISPECIES: hypothetical protein [Corallococcus]|uniref:hypothetical protein n=1 Tax=Corallococcus TaxID=83461 RepID=UPI0011C40996|nr:MULTISPECIES: hypothetical protein [Corallococcus]